MKVNTLKELKKVLQLCREQGVVTIKIDGIEMQLGSMPVAAKSVLETFPEENIKVPQYTPVNVQNTATEAIEASEADLSEEQLLFYSARAESPN